MPISLEHIQLRLLQRLEVVDSAFDRHVAERSSKYRMDRNTLQEGLVSHLWQSWCAFCREVVLASVKGARTLSGALTTSPHSTRSEMEIAYIAKQLSLNNHIGSIKSLSGNHLEPTWGDYGKINSIIVSIGCSNNGKLASAFGVASRIKDLQLCRNSCAHISADRIREINSAKVRYISTTTHHPSDLIFWLDPTSQDFLWKSWIDEIETISELAIA